MSANKTQPTKISAHQFLDTCADPRQRTDAKALAKLMQKVSGQKPTMWGSAIVGFGSYHYKYESGREGDAPILGFSPRKSANVLYGAIGFPGADALLAQLGRHTTGKGCLYIKSLADVDVKILESLLAKAFAASAKARPE